MITYERVNIQGDVDDIARGGHASVVHRGRLFVVMGYGADWEYRGDMHWTHDCIRWHRQSISVDSKGNAILPRSGFTLTSHNGKVYLIGGWSGSQGHNHVYVSEDMFRWVKLPDASWRARSLHAAASFNGKLWVMGGTISGVGNTNEVWWSEDGVSWVQEADIPGGARFGHRCIVFNNRMFVVGGRIGSDWMSDVWYTVNGRDWVRMESNANFSGRAYFTLTVIGRKQPKPQLLITGGLLTVGPDTYSSEVWHSGEGNNWYQGESLPIVGGINDHTVHYFNNRVVVVGGLSTVFNHNVYIGTDKMFGGR